MNKTKCPHCGGPTWDERDVGLTAEFCSPCGLLESEYHKWETTKLEIAIQQTKELLRVGALDGIKGVAASQAAMERVLAARLQRG